MLIFVGEYPNQEQHGPGKKRDNDFSDAFFQKNRKRFGFTEQQIARYHKQAGNADAAQRIISIGNPPASAAERGLKKEDLGRTMNKQDGQNRHNAQEMHPKDVIFS